MFKRGKYRSWKNYLSRARAEHIRRGGAWTDALAQEARESFRSVLRGIGPARQSASLDSERIHGFGLGTEPMVEGGTTGPGRWAVVATFWVLREIEIVAAPDSNWIIDTARRRNTARLPVTKIDPAATGC